MEGMSKTRPAGRCSMRGSCGQKSFFSPQLPCPVDQQAETPDEPLRSKLLSVCGQEFASGDVCCTADQVDSLKANLEQAEPLVSACPSCRNNFRSFFCSFTCSPNQSQFLDVSSTQKLSTPGPDGDVAVKSVEFYVGESFKKGFFESCKDVKFGASNGFIMDLIGGGAKDPGSFLKFMGDEKPLVGSPFQINFPKGKGRDGQQDDEDEESQAVTIPSPSSVSIQSQHQEHEVNAVSISRQNQSSIPPIPFNPSARNCDDPDLLSLCACTDCPRVCPTLPTIPTPNHKERCTLNLFGIKTFSCFTITLALIYLLVLTGFVIGYGSSSFKKSKKLRRMGIRHRNSGISVSSEGSGYERVRLSGDDLDEEEQVPEDANRRRGSTRSDRRGRASTSSSNHHRNSTDSNMNNNRGLVGAVGLGGFDSEDLESRGRGVNFNTISTTSSGNSDQLNNLNQQPLNALATTQPRSYMLNTHLTNFFYRLGLKVSKNPFATFALACVLIAIANLGWLKFQVETDPVKLWVSKSSESKLRKEHFDENFGPFYKVEQVFLMDSTGRDLAKYRDRSSSNIDPDPIIDLDSAKPVLSWEVLKWWSEVEEEISNLKSYPNGYQLSDVCFSPTGEACVVQSILGYFSNDLDNSGVNEENWEESLNACSDSPVECLPIFGQPLERNIVLGGIPDIVRETVPGGNENGGQIKERSGKGSDARSMVTTWILNNSLNSTELKKIEEWEKGLEQFLFSVAGMNLREVGADEEKNQIEGMVEHPLGVKRRELGLEMAISTGVSLEEEIGGSSNTDIGIVVLSYLLMFLYAALALGGSGSSSSAFRGDQSSRGTSVGTGLAERVLSFLPNRNSSSASRSSPSNAGLSRTSLKDRIFRRLFVNSKFSLGLFGILIVLISVTSAVGLFSAIGIKVTLVIAEVIPFLVLAVGVDNIFLLSNEMDRQTSLAASNLPERSRSEDLGISRGSNDQYEEDSLEDEEGEEDESGPFGSYRAGRDLSSNTISSIPSSERAARALSRMGPSILLSATTQVSAFLLGALVPMPAVRNFALYAAGSMFLAAVLQCTVFVAAMALDADRTESNRLDCLPCLRIRTPISLSIHSHDYSNSSSNNDGFQTSSDNSGWINEGPLSRFIRRHYAPFLLKPIVKKTILALFAGTFTLSLIGARKVKMGLDQRLALPTNSYLRDYFDALDTFLDVGPPVYFVALSPDDDDSSRNPNGASMSPSLSPSLVSGQRSLCGRFTTCQPLSLANILEGERKRPESSFIAQPASSWFDDFFGWLNPALESCCRVKINDPNTFCSQRDSEFNCQPCFQNREPGWNITLEYMPENQEFYKYLNQWLASPSDAQCPLGGQAAYSSAISLKIGSRDEDGSPDLAEESIKSSHFRTYHTPLRTQDDFIDALASAERISKEIKQSTGIEVYAYSLFYVFFDQYLSLTSLSFQVLGSSLLCIFAFCTFLLGSWRTSLVVTICVLSVLISIFGTMGFLGINLNALTLVNLDVCAAIAVEFCAHLSRAFMRAPGSLPRSHPLAQKERDERTWAALSDVGSSVLSGITGTKLVGISVLAFTRSELLKLYYAQMWFALILIGVTHGLILLPVLLSYFGGRGYASGEEEFEVRHRLLRANDTAQYRPFVSDEVEDDSDDEL